MTDRFKFRVWNNKMQKFHIVFSMHGIINDTLEGYAKDDNFVLEQCTGLKDKNGNLIYEGDILKGGNAKYKVVWQGSSFVLKVKTAGSYPLGGSADLLEVIGNIHENADLLELKQND